jgi:hypothetical protein
MDTWAANTLRTLGIIFTSLIVLLAGLWLLLLSLCFGLAGLSNPRAFGSVFMLAGPAVLLLLGGISLITYLARGLFPSPDHLQPAPVGIPPILLTPPKTLSPAPRTSTPLHLSPSSRKAVDRLVLAMIAQVLLSPIAWIFGQFHFWTAPHSLAPHPWISVLLGPFILYHLPYAVLSYLLLRQPSRRVFTYALAVPSVILFQSLFSLGVVFHYYVHEPLGSLLLFLPWAIHVAVLVLAFHAIQRTGLRPEPPRLIAAAVLVFLYFSAINAVTPLLYRFNWR